MNNAPTATTTPLPAPIVAALGKLIQRTRQLVLIRGLCASCATAIGAFLLIMLLDSSFTLMSLWPRWVMTLLAYSAWSIVTFCMLIRPLTRSFTLAGIAHLIEAHHPELQERISSAVQLLSSRDLPSIRGSETLIAALTEEAVRETATLQPKREISFIGAIPVAVAAFVVCAVLATLYLVKPRETRFLLARAAAPFLNLPNVQAVDLVIEPGDTLIAAGSSLQVSLLTSNRTVAKVQLCQVDRSGNQTLTEMMATSSLTNGPVRRFTAILPGALSDFRYRVHAGDALSRYFTVRVATPPVIEHLDIRYRYPEYSRLGMREEHDGTGTIRALAGTELTLSAQVNKPSLQAVLAIHVAGSTNTIKGILRSTGRTFVYDFVLLLPKGLEGGWTIRLTDEINLSNTPFEFPIQALPDNPPSVTITSPVKKELRLNRDSRLPVSFHAEDDYGLAVESLVFTLPGSTNELIRPLPSSVSTTNPTPRILNGETVIVLDDPLFAKAPRVSFRVRASDTLPGTARGPQSSDSETLTIILDDHADSWAEQVLDSQDQRVRDGIQQMQRKLDEAREKARSLNNPKALEQPLTDDTTRKIDTLQDTLASADNAARDTASDLDKGFFAPLASTLTALAENHISKAENMAGQIRLVDTPAERMGIISNITAEIATSQEALNRALKDHELAQAAVRRAVQLDRLADKQSNLARAGQERESPQPVMSDTSSSTDPASDADKKWKQEQDRVADELARLSRETPGAATQVSISLSNRAALAAAQAAQLAKSQTEIAALTKQETERLQKRDSQWRDLAERQNRLAESARNEPLAAPLSESMRKAARDLEAGKTEDAIEAQSRISEALKQDAGNQLRKDDTLQETTGMTKPDRRNSDERKSDPVSELAAKVDQLRTESQKAGDPTRHPSLSRTDVQKAVQQARTAEDLSRQAVQQAEQAADRARQAAWKIEQQAHASKQAADRLTGLADEATRRVQQAGDNKMEQAMKRAAETARQNSVAARQNETSAREAAKQAAQAAQAANHRVDQARAAAQKAQHSAQKAAEWAQKASAAKTERESMKAQDETSKSVESAIAQAVAAAQTARDASKSAGELRHHSDALILSDFALQQDALRREASGLVQDRTAASESLRDRLSRQVAEDQRRLAGETKALAAELERKTPPPGTSAQATQAAESAHRSAAELENGQTKQAGTSASDAAKALDQLAGNLRTASAQPATRPSLDKQADFSKLAARAENLSGQQKQLAQEMEALAADHPLAALQSQQEQLGLGVKELADLTDVLRDQAREVFPSVQAGSQMDQAAQNLKQAAESTGEVNKHMAKAVGNADPSGHLPSSHEQQQAASQTDQQQMNTARNLSQAATWLQAALANAASLRPNPADAGRQQAPASQAAQDSIAQAYQSARQAAEQSHAADAAQAAAQLSQAAEAAATEAHAKGADPHPSTLQAANPSGNISPDSRLAGDSPLSFTGRIGIKLQDWLKLHGELKDDALQAAATEGPEEYRPIIQRYFHEVSSHKGDD